MEVSRIGIHESVDAVFPPDRLADALGDVDPAVSIVGDDELADCDALVTFAHREEFLDADLQWVHSIQAGVDRFPFDAFEARGVALTNSTGIHGESVGETGVGLLLMLARRLHRHVAHQQSRTWQRPAWDEAFTIAGSTLCVVGLGTLGQGIAKRANALGMDVVGVRRSGDSAPDVRKVYRSENLHEAIADAAFVAVAVPLTDDTRHLFGDAEFERMRDDAYVLNVARGAVVDEPALVDALQNDELAGAALDVFEEEPLPEDSPLWGMDDVIVTPHCAAFDRNYYSDIADLVRENVERTEHGEELVNRVV